jgi:hypothetical protein
MRTRTIAWWLTLLAVAVVSPLVLAGPPPTTIPNHPPVTPPPRPVEPMRIDIAVDDVWADPGTCDLWVRWINKGNVRITKTLGFSIKVAGTEVAKGFQGFDLAPGAVMATSVGTTQNPIKVVGQQKLVDARIDTGWVLNESDRTKGNNRMRKYLSCTLLAPPPLP